MHFGVGRQNVVKSVFLSSFFGFIHVGALDFTDEGIGFLEHLLFIWVQGLRRVLHWLIRCRRVLRGSIMAGIVVQGMASWGRVYWVSC